MSRSALALLAVAGVALQGVGCHRERAARTDAGADTDAYELRGHAPGGEVLTFGVLAGRIVDAKELPASSPIVDVGARFVVPAFIDSHVHLSYYPVTDSLPQGGVVAAVDFAAPLASLGTPSSLPVRRSGPMLTPPGGYPTTGWGAGGYGLEVATPAEATSAVDRLLDAGADFIKAPLMGESGLSDDALNAVVQHAHERGARVAVHALSAVDAQRAILAPVDILAHTPAEALSAETLQRFGTRTVVSTLAAFGSTDAPQNLRALREQGALVLYGTDLGNTREVGIQANEIAALVSAGLDGAAIVRAGTSDPARFWGFDELGTLTPGKRGSFLVLDQDPALEPATLATPHAVVLDGKLLAGAFQ